MKKLQNKETGEIGRLSVDIDRPDNGIRVYHEDGVTYRMYNSLAELNEEWEDYEEPKSGIEGIRLNDMISGRHIVEIDFTKVEEAEKAVEKLKAWKRLKDKGFRFTGITESSYTGADYIEFDIGYDYCGDLGDKNSEINKDLKLLFGGEE